MSYISTVQELPVSAASIPARPLSARAPAPSATTVISTGLQATLGLAIMAGLSLVLCTIAAGAVL